MFILSLLVQQKKVAEVFFLGSVAVQSSIIFDPVEIESIDENALMKKIHNFLQYLVFQKILILNVADKACVQYLELF